MDFYANIKDWYVEEYPTDDMGEDLEGTFLGAMICLRDGSDFYEYIGVADSTIRQHIFEKLAEMCKIEYDDIYNVWMGGTSDGFEIALRNIRKSVFRNESTISKAVKFLESRGYELQKVIR